jgi:hypothetical protein
MQQRAKKEPLRLISELVGEEEKQKAAFNGKVNRAGMIESQSRIDNRFMHRAAYKVCICRSIANQRPPLLGLIISKRYT